MRLDPVAHAVETDGASVSLTPTEFRLLAALAAHPGEPLHRRDLRAAAWPTGGVVHDNTLDAHLARLRRKLREVPDAPEIRTVHGVGYSLN